MCLRGGDLSFLLDPESQQVTFAIEDSTGLIFCHTGHDIRQPKTHLVVGLKYQTAVNVDKEVSSMFGCKSGHGSGRKLRGVEC